ncbi:MAG: C2 domain-containing protein [Myxococcota bacterium]
MVYTIHVHSAKISKRKGRFRQWDAGFGKMTLPDVFVRIEAKGQRFETSVMKNQLFPQWKESKRFRLQLSDRVYMQVVDKDPLSDDLIAKASFLLSELLQKPVLSFGKVKQLQLSIVAKPSLVKHLKVGHANRGSGDSVPTKRKRPQAASKAVFEAFCLALQKQHKYCLSKCVASSKTSDRNKVFAKELLKDLHSATSSAALRGECVHAYQRRQRARTRQDLLSEQKLKQCLACLRKARCVMAEQRKCPSHCAP